MILAGPIGPSVTARMPQFSDFDGRRVNNCVAHTAFADDSAILTIEGHANGDALEAVQVAPLEHDGFQCGSCTPG